MKSVALLVFLFFIACNQPARVKTYDTFLIICRDVTDSLQLIPDSTSVLQSLPFKESKEAKVRVRISPISNKTYNSTQDYILDDDSSTQENNRRGDMLYRENQVVDFYYRIGSGIASQNRKFIHATQSTSECFQCICSQLTILANSDYTRKGLWLYSNLFENSRLFTVYSKKEQQLIYAHPDSVQQVLEHTNLLPPDLTGITVNIAFIPRSAEEDRLFGVMVSIYKNLLIKRGAKVYVRTNNDFSFNE